MSVMGDNVSLVEIQSDAGHSNSASYSNSYLQGWVKVTLWGECERLCTY